MATWIKLTGKTIRKLARVVFFMLFQSESSKVNTQRRTLCGGELKWDYAKGKTIIATPDIEK